MELTGFIFKTEKIKLSKAELIIFEADLFVRVCLELKNYFKGFHKKYFDLIKLDLNEKENIMLEMAYVKWIIEDILSTQEYTLEGIAHYTHIPQEVIYDVLIGNNLRPSAVFLEKIILLHRQVKADLYHSIGKKVAEQILTGYDKARS